MISVVQGVYTRPYNAGRLTSEDGVATTASKGKRPAS
jgi:hypothetical protein